MVLMIGSDDLQVSSYSRIRKRRLIIFLSPWAVILLGQLAARTLGPLIGTWSWAPLIAGYWSTILFLAAWAGGSDAIKRWLQPSRGAWYWPLLALSIGVLPTLPLLFPDAWRLFLQTRIWLPTLLLVTLNPFAEELYWRGLLLDAMEARGRWLAVLCSSSLFMINHMWMSVMVIAARNPAAMAFQFLFAVMMSITYFKTHSLRWSLAAHFLTNLLTPTVAMFLNLYVPSTPW